MGEMADDHINSILDNMMDPLELSMRTLIMPELPQWMHLSTWLRALDLRSVNSHPTHLDASKPK